MSSRKGYNPAKRAIAVASAALRDIVLIYTPEFEGAILINPKKKIAIKPTLAIQRALISVPHTWSILLCAFGKKDGEIYMRSEEYPYKERVYHDVIERAIVDAHEALAKELGDEFHSVGYIASIQDLNWSEDAAFKLFEEVGGI